MQFKKIGECCDILDAHRIPIKAADRKKGPYPYYGANGVQDHVDDYIFDDDLVLLAEDGGNFGSKVRPIAYRVSGKCWVNNHAHVLKPKSGLDVDYLCYSLMFYDVTRIINGATRAKLTQSAMSQMRIPYVDLTHQKAIVNTLNKIQKIIENRKKEKGLLDKSIKARFVEMFGNIGQDNKGWRLTTLGKACIINPHRSKDINTNLEYSFVPMPSVSEHGSIDASECKQYDEVKNGYTYFQENDVLFAKITPCMENGKGAVAQGLKNGIGFGSTEFHILRPIDGISNPYWLYEITMQPQFRIFAERHMTGSGGQRRVPASFLKNFPISIPPLDLQNHYADFFQQVDKSKAAIQKSIDETQLLYDSLMQKYFG